MPVVNMDHSVCDIEMSNLRHHVRRLAAFTLIELLVAISLSVIILGAVYFSFSSALESWYYTRDELALQHVMSSLLEEVVEGTDWSPGLRSALEVSQARDAAVSFVPPWSEEHFATGGRESFQLTQFVKPGAGLPTAELRLPDTETFRPLPVIWDDPDNQTTRPRLRPGFELVPGSTVRFSYRPDPQRVPEAIMTVEWDPQTQAVVREWAGGKEPLAKNPFGVAITDCRFRYYDQTNAPLTESGDVDQEALPMITAVEINLTGQLGSHTLTLPGMVMLRNSMRHSGLIILRKGLRVPIPDSRAIHTFVLTNLIGITHGDELQLEVRPAVGRGWRLSVRFERYGQVTPVIAQVTVEYPPGQVLFTDRPNTSAYLGLDPLTVGLGGLHDYDDDPDVDDVVLVEGDPVYLTVTKLDIHGAACFIQP